MNSIYRKRWSENKRIRTANTLKRVHIEGFKRFQRLLRCYQLLAYLMQFISSWCIVTTGVAVSALLASCAWWWSDTLTPFQIILLGALSVSLIIAFIIAIGIPSLLRWMRLTDVTREIEREFPYLEERLTNSIALASVSLPQEGISLALARAAIQDAVAAFARVRWWQPLIRRLRKCARNVIATLSVVAMVALIMFCTGATPNALRATFARAYQEWLFLRVGQLMLKPLPRIVLRGSSVIVHAVALRASPRRVQLLVIDQVTGKRMRRWMDEVDDSKSSYSRHTRALGFEREVPIVATYKTTIRNLEHDVMLFATSGNVRSQAHRIRVVDAPTALRMEIIAEPPAYTGDAPQTWIDPHKPVTALKGSWVTVAIEANNPLKVAHLTTADGFKRSMRIHEHNALLRFRLLKSHQLRIAMQDVYGFTGATRWLHIRMRCDQLPRVTIRAPRQRELQVLPTASIPVVVHAVDDYGLNELKVEFRGRVPRRYVELGRYDGDRREATEGLLIHLAGGVRPGDVIKYRGCAIDNDTVSGPKLGTSAWFTIRVVTLRQFLSNLNEFQRYAIERIESIAQRHARLMQELQQFQERWVDATPNERMRM
ncbi:MAG TPA: DUF4175 family protein, partial [Armatimonadetes bacterium]|nr:DUF4175 family protein [Armatimonadota bacterium]